MTTHRHLKAALVGFGLIGFGAEAVAESLTVYAAGPRDLAERLSEGFASKEGIQVDLFQATTGQVMARLEAERGNPIADVVISASWESAVALHEAGDLMPYVSPHAATVPDSLKHTHYVAQGASAIALVWNTQSDVPAPADWRDLTDEIYRDQVTMPDPAQSGSAFELLAGMLAADEDATWELLADLKANEIIVPGPNNAALNPVLQGAKSVVFGAVDYISMGQRAAGETIEVIFPTSGTVIAPRPIMILSYASNPEAAERFVDYVLSEEGQAMVADVFLMPARTDVEGLRPGVEELRILDYDADAFSARRDEILARFRETMGMM